MRILSSADWHINLHKKKIPYLWQMNRYQEMFDKLHTLEKDCDVHVIAGDLFDKEPETDESSLLLSFLNSVTIPTIVIPGNHEATSKGKTFWDHFKFKNTIPNPLVHIFTENGRIELCGQGFCMFPYGSVQTNQLPAFVKDDILVTHIRGEVPPHITAEYDFEKLRPWKLVLLGDLHFNHRYQDFNVYYPGSPVNTTFDRDDSRDYGVDIITMNANDYTVKFVPLNLPKLIRKTIKAGEINKMISNGSDHTIFEVVGSVDELAKVEKTDLLDKKMVSKPKIGSVLDLKDKTVFEELELWLKYIKVTDTETVLNEFKQLGIQ